MNKAEQIAYLQLLDEGIERAKKGKLSRLYNSLYPWQLKFIGATKDHDACMLMASNQSGKSRTGCIVDAYHLTGDYPDDWGGLRFDFAPLCWLLGYSGEKTRDLLQNKLFGRLKDGVFEGGYISSDRIIDYIAMSGTTGACREVRVRHKLGGISVCQFWSYSQGQHALMGDVVDWYHIDEEPKDAQIYPQVITRTLNGNKGKGGSGILTFTPENGRTQLVCQFMDEPEDGMYLQGAKWSECPHMTPEKQVKFLAKYPKYQREMRANGSPLMGAGLIFEHSEEQITCRRFQIPRHFYLINGMDFGWDHPQAHVQLAIDPDNACVYVTQAWKKANKQPYEAWAAVKQWAKGVPTAWPSDGQQHKQQSGNKDAVQQKSLYSEAGWEMLDDSATWSDGGNGVGVGLLELNRIMDLGLFKVFDDLSELLDEIRQYHTKLKDNGLSEIVKINDDLLDAVRYGFMMARFAEQKPVERDDDYNDFEQRKRAAGACGY